jgi:hypothetical protein
LGLCRIEPNAEAEALGYYQMSLRDSRDRCLQPALFFLAAWRSFPEHARHLAVLLKLAGSEKASSLAAP